MTASVSSTQAGLGWVGRTVTVLAALSATAVATAAPAHAPAAGLDPAGVSSALDSGPQVTTGTDALYVMVLPATTADLAVAGTGAATVAVGSAATYRLSVTNLAAAVGQATLTDRLPRGFDVRRVDTVGCALEGGRTLTCTLTVAGLAVETVTVSGVFATAGVARNTARVLSVGDANPGNDTATATTRVTP